MVCAVTTVLLYCYYCNVQLQGLVSNASIYVIFMEKIPQAECKKYNCVTMT